MHKKVFSSLYFQVLLAITRSTVSSRRVCEYPIAVADWHRSRGPRADRRRHWVSARRACRRQGMTTVVRLIPVNAMSSTKNARDGIEYSMLASARTGGYHPGRCTHSNPSGSATTSPGSDAPSAITRWSTSSSVKLPRYEGFRGSRVRPLDGVGAAGPACWARIVPASCS